MNTSESLELEIYVVLSCLKVLGADLRSSQEQPVLKTAESGFQPLPPSSLRQALRGLNSPIHLTNWLANNLQGFSCFSLPSSGVECGLDQNFL